MRLRGHFATAAPMFTCVSVVSEVCVLGCRRVMPLRLAVLFCEQCASLTLAYAVQTERVAGFLFAWQSRDEW